jgi:hypothetical protein
VENRESKKRWKIEKAKKGGKHRKQKKVEK